ncbi:MAG: MraY family glycosyltransferase [Arenicellales bacterium]|nr:MraY family glycosyltransferase [Arenicellales bacterium]
MDPQDFYAYAAAGGLCVFLLYLLGPIAQRVGLVDRPSGRKQQLRPVALIGGIAIVVSFFLATLLMPISLTEYRVLYFCIVLLFVTGIVDDLRELPPAAKFVVQLIVALALVFLDEQLVRFVGDILDQSDPNEYEPLGLDILAIPLTVFAMLGVINAFNLIDGLDGLCGGVALIALAALMGLAFHHGGAVTEFKLLGIVLVTVAAFLIFNLSILGTARQVYLGDAGSMVIGLILVYFLINLSQRGIPVVESGVPIVKSNSAPWLIALPLMDTVNVMLHRLRSGRSPLKPDRTHIHHLLLDVGIHRYAVLAILLGLQLFCTAIGVLGTHLSWPDWVLFWSMFPGYIGFALTTWMLARRRRQITDLVTRASDVTDLDRRRARTQKNR